MIYAHPLIDPIDNNRFPTDATLLVVSRGSPFVVLRFILASGQGFNVTH